MKRDKPFIDEETGAVVVPVPSYKLPRDGYQAVEGFSIPKLGIVVYNKDLPRPKKDFVLEHELAHADYVLNEAEADRRAYQRTGYMPSGREAIHPHYPNSSLAKAA